MYQIAYQSGFNAKLGLADVKQGDAELGNDFLALLAAQKVDFTLGFRHLGSEDLADFKALFEDQDPLSTWLLRWRERLDQDNQSPDQGRHLMQNANPALIPRNHRIEQAIMAALEDDFEPFHRLCGALVFPYLDQTDDFELTLPPQPKEVVPHTFCGT